jgi:processive 1,2-diacylglycerol beta-glucosyltransferase
MFKVLVLSCSTGGGHNSAASAITEELRNKGVQVDFKEYLDLINYKIANVVNKLYISSTKGNGAVFKRVYKLGELYEKTKITSPVYGVNKLHRRKLYNYIVENKYDYVVVTHLFPAEVLTAIKKQHDIHFIAVATDYKSIPFWPETNPDYFIIPHKDLIEDFTKKGISHEKLIPFGIPVSTNFSKDLDKSKIFAELNLDKNKKYILVMTGSMGFGNVTGIIDVLQNEISETILVACGNNKKVYEDISNNYDSNKVIPIGFTPQIYKYMCISELLLTKPGGLTTTEAATINVPIIHTMPIPGCETYNAEFFESRGMSISCKNTTDIKNAVISLLDDKNKVENIIKAQKQNIDKNACSKICEFIIDEIRKYSK